MSEFPPPSAPSPESAAESAATASPGWYFDGQGQRWWDGVALGPAQTSSDDSTFATLAHLGSIFGGFILPLVMYLISKDGRRPETRYHAREALNFQITYMILYIPAVIIYMVVVLAQVGSAGSVGDDISGGFVVALVLFMLLAFAASITAIVLGILGAIRANKGVRYRYPVSIRFLKDSK